MAEEAIDLIDALNDHSEKDVVAVIYRSGHARNCDYKPEVKDGIVWCLTCGQSIDSFLDVSEFECALCGCIKNNHDWVTGRCLQCGKGCGHAAVL